MRSRDAGGEAVAVADNVATWEGGKHIVDTCIENFGRIDGAVCVAGILRERMLFNMSEDEFDAVIAVHLKGHFTIYRHAAAIMRKQESGSLVGFTSGAYAGSIAQANYSAAKGGIVSLTRSAAAGLHRYGVQGELHRPGRAAPGCRRTFRWSSPTWVSPRTWPRWSSTCCRTPRAHVTGQVYTAVGSRIAVWNQPVEVRQMTTEGRWTPAEDRETARLRDRSGEDGPDRASRGVPQGCCLGTEAQRLRTACASTTQRPVPTRRSTCLWLERARRPDTTGSSFRTRSHIRLNRTPKYPFNPDGTREFLEDKPFLDPFAMIAALGAVTESLRFVTFVVKLPIRHPVLVAKQASTVAVLTNNRFAFGVGTSPWPEDYELVGVPWENRGRRMDECIEVIRGLTSPGWFEYHGEVFDVPRVKMSPVPDKPIPVLIGGHGKPALRRAATIGDGWMHGGGDPEDLPGLIDRLRRPSERGGQGRRSVRGARDLCGCVQHRRSEAARGPRGHRRHGRVPLAIPGGPRHPTAQREGRPTCEATRTG